MSGRGGALGEERLESHAWEGPRAERATPGRGTARLEGRTRASAVRRGGCVRASGGEAAELGRREESWRRMGGGGLRG